MQSIKNIFIGLGILFSIALSASFIVNQSNPRIAFVRSAELIYNYDGTKDAQQNFSEKKARWQANLDTLRTEYDRAVNRFNSTENTLSPTEQIEQRRRLISQEAQLQQYASSVNEQMDREDAEMMQGVLNQINSFTEEYAQKHGYDLILGTTEAGNVLYGTKTLDITKTLLESLNKTYHGQ